MRGGLVKMKERELEATTNTDPTLVGLSEKQLRVLKKACNDIGLAIGTMKANLETLKAGDAELYIGFSEHKLVDIMKICGYDGALKREAEERHKRIASVNLENRELRMQLGEKVSAEDVRECLKNMKAAIKKWWDKEGFCLVESLAAYPHAAEIKLSCRMGIVREEDLEERLLGMGYEINMEEDHRDCSLKDNDKNREVLLAIIKRRFPSAEIRQYHCNYYGKPHIESVMFIVRDYDDIIGRKTSGDQLPGSWECSRCGCTVRDTTDVCPQCEGGR
jgi:hypothetical protein